MSAVGSGMGRTHVEDHVLSRSADAGVSRTLDPPGSLPRHQWKIHPTRPIHVCPDSKLGPSRERASHFRCRVPLPRVAGQVDLQEQGDVRPSCFGSDDAPSRQL